jgi:hypothetical protein
MRTYTPVADRLRLSELREMLEFTNNEDGTRTYSDLACTISDEITMILMVQCNQDYPKA